MIRDHNHLRVNRLLSLILPECSLRPTIDHLPPKINHLLGKLTDKPSQRLFIHP